MAGIEPGTMRGRDQKCNERYVTLLMYFLTLNSKIKVKMKRPMLQLQLPKTGKYWFFIGNVNAKLPN